MREGSPGYGLSRRPCSFPGRRQDCVLALLMAGQVSLLSLGEETAVGLGGKIRRIRFMSMAAVLILTGSSVAIAGPISFVGLVVPHGVRFLAGADYRKVIPCSVLGSALLVVAADIISRLIHPPLKRRQVRLQL